MGAMLANVMFNLPLVEASTGARTRCIAMVVDVLATAGLHLVRTHSLRPRATSRVRFRSGRRTRLPPRRPSPIRRIRYRRRCRMRLLRIGPLMWPGFIGAQAQAAASSAYCWLACSSAARGRHADCRSCMIVLHSMHSRAFRSETAPANRLMRLTERARAARVIVLELRPRRRRTVHPGEIVMT